MLRQDELGLVYSLKEEYEILVCNAHDIRLRSEITGHEWIIISPYDGSSSELLHRHSNRNPFHHQGRYGSLSSALNYIRRHDTWFHEKMQRREIRVLSRPV